MDLKKRKVGRYMLFPHSELPLLFGWVITLVIIEEATLAEPFLFNRLLLGTWADYANRIAFLLGVGFSLPFFTRHRRFPPWIPALIASLFLGLGFLPIAESALLPLRLLGAVFLGICLAPFGIVFFFLFDNRQKGFSLFLALLLTFPLFFLRRAEPYLSFGIALLGLLFTFFPIPEAQPSRSLSLGNIPDLWLWLLSFVAFLFQGVLALALLRELLGKEERLIYGILAGGIGGLLLSLFFLKNRRFLMTYGLYFSFWLSSIGGLLLFLGGEAPLLFAMAVLFAAAHVLGLFSLYYVLGVYTKKYQNMAFYNGGAILASLAYALSLLFPLLFPFFSSVYWAIVFLGIPLLLFLILPFFGWRKKHAGVAGRPPSGRGERPRSSRRFFCRSPSFEAGSGSRSTSAPRVDVTADCRGTSPLLPDHQHLPNGPLP
jgi:hypothetical protein